MIVLMLGILVMNAFLFVFSRGKYDELVSHIDSKSYPAKPFMPMALYLLDRLRYSFHNGYDRKLLLSFAELYGARYSSFYLKIHWANKLALLLLLLQFLTLVGVFTGPDSGYFVFSLLVAGAIFWGTDYDLNTKVKRRRMLIRLDFPDFLNKLTLLINAGMTVHRAWEKIVSDNRQQSPFYKELEIVTAEIKAGKSENRAYEDFAKRCRTPEITKFVSVIIQNLKKGNSELVSILRVQANDCWDMRKNAAKKLGEEASTKMLLPMMIMFVAILIIVSTPAILAMQGI